MRTDLLRRALLPIVLALCGGPWVWGDRERPDVLVVVVDDLNDWISLLDETGPIKTPHLERLAARGLLFTRAYCMSPACNPSRAATWTGRRPTTSGVYGNRSDWRAAMPDRPTVMQLFRQGGYRIEGAGKIFHHHLQGAFHDSASFDAFQSLGKQNYPRTKLNGAPEYGSRNTDWGVWPPREADSLDAQTVDYCVKALRNPPEDRPLFLACGIFKPHSPFFAPARYHQPYRALPLPPRATDDWSDLPRGAEQLMASKRWFWRGMMELDQKRPGAYRDFLRAYAACATFADAQLGRLLEPLAATQRGRDTIVVLWSDHGFHLGEKDHIEKFALWEKANHIPFIIVAPGRTQPGTRCHRPVDMSIVYPTLLELCGLPVPPCDGKSVVPLLAAPDAPWDTPALMTYGRGNHAVRSERYRYIRYADGSEELYDHQRDPRELANLAAEGGQADVLHWHRAWLPRREAPPIGDLQARLPR